MDITETFRNEDISKTDFFDFVVGPEVSDTQTLQQFSKQMRTVNAYLGNADGGDLKETNNNTTSATNSSHGDGMLEAVQGAGGGAEAGVVAGYDPSFWSCDKETVRLETAILEDLNKYCWSQQEVNSAAGTTDGHIYTLTVLNGVDQSTPWFRPPLAAIIKEEDGSLSSPGSLEHMQQSTLDIDSILNIIPAGAHLNNGYGAAAAAVAAAGFAAGQPSPNTDGLIKSEPYTYEDSGYADNKDELATTMIIDTPMLEAHDTFNNNNNDWKLSNNNNSTGNPGTPANTITVVGTADSLLRSALQGKAFVRYNGAGTATTAAAAGKAAVKTDTHSELRRALSTPPAHADPKEQQDDVQQQPQPPASAGGQLITGIDPGAILFVEAASGGARLADENASSAHSMDDILLSQLDAASYPEDYEKLKRIANEVAESVQQYCLEPIYALSTATGPGGASGAVAGATASEQQPVLGAAQLAQQPAVTSSKQSQHQHPHAHPPHAHQTKKYKRSNSGGGGGGGSKQPSVQGATSTSNGVRKERSLHYCSICSKGFKDKYSVNVHIRTHTGEKPFACSLCGKSFRQKAHLAKHYQTHIAQKNAAVAGGAGGQAGTGAGAGAGAGSGSGSGAGTGAASKPAKAR